VQRAHDGIRSAHGPAAIFISRCASHAVGPVKTMILALNARRAAKLVDDLLKKGTTDIRERLDSFAKSEGIEV